MDVTPNQREYWRRNLRLTGVLLAIWFLSTFVVIWFARELNERVMAGFPLAFYMGAQGSPLIYLSVIWFYAQRMNQLDRAYDVDEDEGV
jgi:putative solute:sodium symporter small subunit